jgi:alpha-L-fucosidase
MVLLNGSAPDSIDSVVVLEIEGEPQITAANQIQQHKNGTVSLPASKAVINNVFGSHVKYEDSRDCIGFWTHPKATVEWTFTVTSPGTFRVTALVASEKESAFTVSLAGNAKIDVPATGGYDSFTTIELGTFEVKEAGTQRLVITPVKKGWNPVNLRMVTLEPVEP